MTRICLKKQALLTTCLVVVLTTAFPTVQQTPLDVQWCKSSPTWSLREEHLIGTLPWAESEEPIPHHYSGHIPIRTWSEPGSKGGDTSMYYWFIPAINPKTVNPPLIVWLQGGPGSSSMIALFYEMGPLWVDANMKLHRRNVTWADDYSMLFIDQPVGTGYSYVTHEGESDNDLLQQLKIVLESEQDKESASSHSSSSVRSTSDRHYRHRFSSSSSSHLKQQQQQQQRMMMPYADAESEAYHGDETSSRRGGVGPPHFHGYVKDERGVASDLMVFLHEFFRRYPEQRGSDLFLTGESYAGKFVPTFAEAIVLYNEELKEQQQDARPQQCRHGHRHQEQQEIDQQQPQEPIRLRGIALGNSLTDPVSQVQAHADVGFALGYLDNKQWATMSSLQQQAVQAAARSRFVDSNRYRNQMFELFTNVTGGINWYDVRKGLVPNDWSLMEKFLNLDEVKDSLNVAGPRMAFLRQQEEEGEQEEGTRRHRNLHCTEDEVLAVIQRRNATRFEKDPLVREAMASDIMRTSAPVVGRLLDKYGIRVLAFQGVFDFRDGVAGSHYWIEHLSWYGREQFQQQKRKLWRLELDVAGGGGGSGFEHPGVGGSGGGEGEKQKPPVVGYVTRYGHLANVAVLGAGHNAPMNQAHVLKELIRSLVEDKELTTEETGVDLQ
ncbi:hypothetical protein DFQ27_003108 [Actinomortierella ambigua]|uniref:Carboxypeptidase n=1 Tax=Actinomortierella ambigua TaxID=1343610 RepID=A0A9P6QA22_9FUNG|nr:hypothetical protein DFQ27_003108 [Actinomortierella ambigua]